MATYIDQRDAAITAIQALIAPNGVGAITGQVHQDNEVGQTEDAYLNLFAYDNFGFVIVRTGIDPATGNEVNTAAQNGANLIAAYAAASALTPNGQPLSTTNRAAVLVPPGVYSFGAGKMTMDTEFVDIVGLGAPESIVITSQYAVNDGTGTITKTCDNAIIKNVTISNGAIWAGAYTELDACGFAPQGVYPNEVIENVIFLSTPNASPFMRLDHEYAGTYKNCQAKNLGGSYPFVFFAGATGKFENCLTSTEFGFGYVQNIASPIIAVNTSGTFINCECNIGFGVYAGGSNASVTGYFKNCKAISFGFGSGSLSNSGRFFDCVSDGGFSAQSFIDGEFVNCTSGFNSFRTQDFNSVNQGRYFNCKGKDNSFGSEITSGTDSGFYQDCVGGDESFNAKNIQGTYERCSAGNQSFGYSTGSSNPIIFTAAKFSYCKGGNFCFGVSAWMDAASEFKYCEGGTLCFGVNNGGAGQYIRSKFYNCVAGNFSFATGVQGPRGTGPGDPITAEFHNCVGGSFCFGSGGGIEMAGLCVNCKAGTWSFGASQSNGAGQWAEASGRFYNCVGGNNCFGASSGSNGGAVASGQFHNCWAGTGSFGSNSAAPASGDISYASGYFVNCSGGSFSFAGHDTAYKTGKFIRCIINGDGGIGIAANDEGPLVENGLMEDCTWVVSGAGEPALLVGNVNAVIPPGTQPPKIYGGKYVSGNGSALSIRVANIANPTPDASIVQIRCNATIDGNINNLATAGTLTTEGNFTDYSGL